MNNFYINSQEKLSPLIELIRAAKILAIDTEFTRETTYYPILSIIQIAVKNSAGEKKSFIIDCLSKLDLREFWSIVSDPQITKILHSSMQDLQIFYHKSKQLPQGIVDTQIMANFCGFGFSVGYSFLVEKLFAKTLDKKQQRSNWQARPLSEKQIEYALMDVFFLEEIFGNFSAILEQNQRQRWFEEEMKNFITKSLMKSDAMLVKNFPLRHKSAVQAAQIKGLILWREDWAKKLDVPRQHFIKDELLERMVVKGDMPQNLTVQMLEKVAEILAAAEQNHSEDLYAEKERPMTEKQKKTFAAAKNLITKIAAQTKFQEQFLITSSDLNKIICKKITQDKIVFGWRHQVFGAELQQLIS